MYYKANKYVKRKAAARPDREKGHRQAFERNKKKIIMAQDVCGICGQPVDKSLKFPHPFSPTVDHIIPVSKGGHPSDLSNLQLAHFKCNRLKSDNLSRVEPTKKIEIEVKKDNGRPNNRDLPLFINWINYNTKNARNLRQEILDTERQGKKLYFDGFCDINKT